MNHMYHRIIESSASEQHNASGLRNEKSHAQFVTESQRLSTTPANQAFFIVAAVLEDQPAVFLLSFLWPFRGVTVTFATMTLPIRISVFS